MEAEKAEREKNKKVRMDVLVRTHSKLVQL